MRGVNNQGFNEWFLKNDYDGPLPFYMTSAVAANYAFKIANEGKQSDKPTFLTALRGMLSPAKDANAGATHIESNKTVATNLRAAVPPAAAHVQSVKV